LKGPPDLRSLFANPAIPRYRAATCPKPRGPHTVRRASSAQGIGAPSVRETRVAPMWVAAEVREPPGSVEWRG
jgi:hypothetical protein